MSTLTTRSFLLGTSYTHMAADTIRTCRHWEKKKNNNNNNNNAVIEVPRDWITTIRVIHRKNKLQVIEMQSTDFKTFKNLNKNRGPLVNRHSYINGQIVRWMKMRKMEYIPDQTGLMKCDTSFNEYISPQYLDLRRTVKERMTN